MKKYSLALLLKLILLLSLVACIYSLRISTTRLKSKASEIASELKFSEILVGQLEDQLMTTDRCSKIQTYDDSSGNVANFFRLVNASNAEILLVPLDTKTFGTLQLFSLSKNKIDSTIQAFVLADVEKMVVIDSLLVQNCKNVSFNNPSRYPRNVSIYSANNTIAAYVLTENGFSGNKNKISILEQAVNKTKVPATENETDTLKTESKQPE